MKHRTRPTIYSARACLEQCNKCREVCTEALTYCLENATSFADIALITVLLECVKFCKINADFIVRQGFANRRILAACRDKCLSGAKVCGRYQDLILEAARLVLEECALSCVAAEERVRSLSK